MKYQPIRNRETRIIRKFLLFPKDINGEGKVFELVYIQQHVYISSRLLLWMDDFFTTKREYKRYMCNRNKLNPWVRFWKY